MSATEIGPGTSHPVPYPFVLEPYSRWEQDKDEPDAPYVHVETKTWKPGCNHDSDGYGDSWAVADKMGLMVLNVVARFKPGTYPERVFYTRQWQDPDGKVFGKGNLRMTTLQNFRVMLRGYRHTFEMAEDL